jgi:hypothetical protein
VELIYKHESAKISSREKELVCSISSKLNSRGCSGNKEMANKEILKTRSKKPQLSHDSETSEAS